MNQNIRNCLHLGRIILTRLGKNIAQIIPKDNNLILFSSWFGTKYSDSPKYMYDYILSVDSKYKAIWYTKDKQLYNHMKNKNLPVVYSRSFKGIWKQLRAIMLVSTVEFYDFNIYFLGGCILLDLNHGFPIKQSGFEIPTYNIKQQNYDRLLRTKIEMYKTASSEFIRDIVLRSEDVPLDRIIFCNKPSIDAFYDSSLREGNNEIVQRIKANFKTIVYMPTHRMAGKKKINISQIFDVDILQKF